MFSKFISFCLMMVNGSYLSISSVKILLANQNEAGFGNL